MVALIAGATGLVGRALLEQLLASGRYAEVHALVRRPLGITHPVLREHFLSFNELGRWSAVTHVDDCFCCLGTTIRGAGSQAAFRKVDYEYPLELARLAQRLGATRFLLVSSMGAAAKSTVFYSRVKGELETAVSALDIPGVEIFRPSLLLGHRSESRPGERIGEVILALLRPFLVGPFRSYRAIEASAVARAMLRTAECPSAGIRIHDSRHIQAIANGTAGA